MWTEATVFIIENVARFFMMLLILRFLMQLVRIPFQQPFGQFLLQMSNWLVLRLRRVIPGLHGYDLASLTAAYLVAVLMHLLLYLMKPTVTQISDPAVWLVLFAWGGVELITMTIYCLFGAIIIQAILSWTSPYHPFAGYLRRLCDPVLAPLRRFIPPVAGVDLTPLIVILLLQLMLRVPVTWAAIYLDKALTFGL